MRRLARMALAALATLLLCTACSQASADMDVSEVASQLAGGVAFGEELTQLDDGAVERVYRLDPSLVTASSTYVGSGATVDEVGVFECADDSAAQQVEAALQERLETEEADYADYKPEEVPKLQDAVLERSGKYVVLCVTADADTARGIVQEAMGS